jgi:hypothetical protein
MAVDMCIKQPVIHALKVPPFIHIYSLTVPLLGWVYALTLPPLRINTPAYASLGQWWQGLQASSCIYLYLKNLYLDREPVFAAIINWITRK